MKDINTIINELVERAKTLAPDFVWEPQTVVSRLFLAVPAKELSNLYIVSEYLHRLTSYEGLISLVSDEGFKRELASALNISLADVNSLIETDIERVGLRFGVKRKQSKPARGIVELYFYTSDLVNIPAGFIFSTKTGLRFLTVSNISANPVYDWKTGLYRLPVVVECERAGTIGNVPANSITEVKQYLANIAFVRNPYPFSNGRDVESLNEYLARIENLRVSTAIGTKSWLENLFLEDDKVIDAVVVGSDDERFLRRYGADVWVLDYEEAESYSVDNDVIFVDNPPVIEGSVSNGNLVVKSPLEDVYARSIYAVERIYRQTSGIPITFSVDKTIYYLQQKVLDPEYYFLSGERNIIVRKALPAYVYIKVDVYPKYGVDSVALKQKIANDLQVFFTGGTTSYGKTYQRIRIGSKIDVSDVVNVIIDEPEVDRIDLDTFEIKIDSRTAQYGVLELYIYEYPVLSASSEIIIH